MKRRQSLVLKCRPAAGALHFSAGCLRQAEGPDQHYTVERQLMVSRNRSTDRIEDFIRIDGTPAIPANFVYCDKPDSSFFLDANHRSGIGPQRWMSGFDGVFEIVRIVIHAA